MPSTNSKNEHVSEEIRHIIRKLLHPEPELRATTGELLYSKYLESLRLAEYSQFVVEAEISRKTQVLESEA